MPYGTVSACIRRGHLFGSTQLLLVAEGSPTTTLNGLRPNIIKCALYEVVKSSVACSPRMLRITTREIAIKQLKFYFRLKIYLLMLGIFFYLKQESGHPKKSGRSIFLKKGQNSSPGEMGVWG